MKNASTSNDPAIPGPAPRPSQKREPLSRDCIVAGAIELADDHGVDALSMRRLAKHLGFEVMSLYNHVDNKDDLLDAMVDLVVAQIEAPPPELAWRPAVRHIAVSAHETLLEHQWAATLWTNRWPGPNRWRHMEALLAVLAKANFADDVADLAFHAVTLHINGFTQQQISYTAAYEREAEMFDRFGREVSGDDFPHVVAHVEYHLDQRTERDEFGLVLDLILDGLEQTLFTAEGSAEPKPD